MELGCRGRASPLHHSPFHPPFLPLASASFPVGLIPAPPATFSSSSSGTSSDSSFPSPSLASARLASALTCSSDIVRKWKNAISIYPPISFPVSITMNFFANPHIATPIATTPIQDLPVLFQSFFCRPAEVGAPELIGCLLVNASPLASRCGGGFRSLGAMASTTA